MAETMIEWTWRRHPKTGKMFPGWTFNPWIGCEKISPACRLCYAAAMDDRRFSRTMGGATPEAPISHWGKGAPRYRTMPDNWKNPLKWNELAKRAGMALAVFCASLADVFDEAVEDAWRDDLFELIAKTPCLDWLILTKRPAKARSYLNARGCPPNVWMGATMENQKCFDDRWRDLLAVNGPALYFASMEPLLGEVDISPALIPRDAITAALAACECHGRPEGRGLGWIIAGGESNLEDKLQSTSTHPDDALSVATQAWAEGVPFFWKQWGDWAPAYELSHNPQAQAMAIMGKVPRRDLERGAGGRRLSYCVGKAAAGHTLDGEERRGMPEIRLLD